jgi:hypothetical protein
MTQGPPAKTSHRVARRTGTTTARAQAQILQPRRLVDWQIL